MIEPRITRITQIFPSVTMLVVLLLATFLRFYRLDAQSFWNDEGNSARLSERPIPLILEGTASDIHPPLYYLLLHGWRGLAGDSEFSLRAFSAFAGIGVVALTYALGTAVGSRRSAVIGAGLTAVNPALIYYSQETRMYALLAFWGVLSTWLLVGWWQRQDRQDRQGIDALAKKQRPINGAVWGIVYSLCVAAGLYTHYFFPAVLLAHGIVVTYFTLHLQPKVAHPLALRPSHFIQWLGLTAVALLLYLPWLPVFIRQAGGRPVVRAPLGEFLWESGRFLAFGDTNRPEEVFWPLVGVMLLGVIGAAVARRPSAVILALLFVPVLFMYAIGTTQPEFFKFMLVAIPPFCLLLTIGGFSLTIDHRPLTIVNLLFAFCFLLLLFGNGRSLQNLYFNPVYARADYRSMAARIAADEHPNAGIILDAPNQWEVFTYYHQNGVPVYPLPKGQPRPDLIEAELNQIAAEHNRLYALFWGETQRDPERLVERWLDAHAFKATEEWVGDVRFVTYAVPDEAATEMETAVLLPFGDSITLNGYTLASDTLQPGDIVQVTLFWQTAEPLTQRYKVFLHLVDESGRLIAQRDSEPGGGLALTTTWQSGQVVVDNHGVLIPAGTANGRYTLLLGLYDLADPTARLPVHTPDRVIDAFPLATIIVESNQ